MRHTIKQGESIESIAHAAGHLWETLWNHPENESLRAKRKSPHVLHPGDVVFVPRLETKTEVVAAGCSHKFKRLGTQSWIELRFLVDGKPRTNAGYTLEVDGQARAGSTDEDGRLRESVHPLAQRAEIRFAHPQRLDRPEVYVLELRHLDPSSEISGAQGRLHMLGYGVGASDGQMNAATRESLRAFQRDHALDETGELDGATQARLSEYTGG
ncbi:MAG TPA: peptidoglycan-binding protein [Myxococcaceae bacterium]|nr:peptidoglycan-binding protein [Myxococcaceae bacterium]